MKPRTRLLVAVLAGIATAVAPMLVGGGKVDLGSGPLSFGALPLFFVGGLVTALTPCVYPLIPITVSIFGAGKLRRSRGHAAALSGTYVLGIATMYSSLGLISAASGRSFGAHLGNFWVAGFFAVAMTAMAASMFGAFELALPTSLQNRLSGVAGIGFGSAFLMGLVCGIVAAPCTGPVLLSALTFVAQTRNLWLGFWLLFAYALGLGSPFFVLGTFTVALPKSGAWMEAVKSVLGVMLVVVAISFIRPFLPPPHMVAASVGIIGAVAAGAIFLAVLVGTLDWSFHGGPREIAMKATGVAVVVLALAFRLNWIVEPANAECPPIVVKVEPKPCLLEIAWETDEPKALARGKAEGKPVLIDFGAKWCTSCMELEHKTYTDPNVREAVSERFIPLKVDGTDQEDPKILALEQKYGEHGPHPAAFGYPLVTVVDREGNQLAAPKITEFLAPPEFLTELAKVK